MHGVGDRHFRMQTRAKRAVVEIFLEGCVTVCTVVPWIRNYVTGTIVKNTFTCLVFA